MGDPYANFGGGGGAQPRSTQAFVPQPQAASVDWYSGAAGGALQFDAAGAQGYGASTSGRMGGQAAAGYGSFEEEAPLLEELGIDVGAILSKAGAVLLNRLGRADLSELDMGGPLLFALVLGSLHLLTGKLHFGVILGWSVVGSTALWLVASSLAGGEARGQEGGSLTVYDCCCLVWYCMLPLLLHAALCLVVPRGVLQAGLALLAVLYAAVTAARLLGQRSLTLSDQFPLVLFPCLLLYTAFGLLNLY